MSEENVVKTLKYRTFGVWLQVDIGAKGSLRFVTSHVVGDESHNVQLTREEAAELFNQWQKVKNG